ncbi:putative ribose ABC transporter [Spiroplasma clarkii]|uniref:ABC transporter permease n=1 Tax=Spiroplasma clarkii TaxID=2139 RepID=UPI000B576716|nr:ABC transporter permease [Spiroplasma clarkii]ARU90997.1 putative ribose ABC transporter [Spiroplasma clarkii]
MNDKQIKQTEFEKLFAAENTKFLNDYGSKITQLTDCSKKYSEKMDAVIASKQIKFKEMISKFNKKIENKIQVLESKKAKTIQEIIQNKQDYIHEHEQKLLLVKTEKLSKSKEYLALQTFESDYQANKFGDLTYNQEKPILEVNLKNRADKIDKITNLNLSKLSLKVATLNFYNEQKKIRTKTNALNLLNQSKLLIIILIIAIIAGFSNQYFFTERIWINLLTNNLDLLLVAFGMTLIILTGGIDLSVGSVLAFAGAVTVKLLTKNYNIYLSLMVGLGTAMVFGLFSGWLISYVKLQPFIVTLVLMLVLRGATSILLESKATALPKDTLQFLTQPFIGKMPWTFFIAITIYLVLFILMKWYKYGRHIYAVGGNIKASYLSGIKTKMVSTSVYVFSGALVFVGTIFYISKLNSIAPTSGNQLELDAIACIALGGTSLLGGKGGVTKTLMGWFVTCVLSTAMNMIGIDGFWQMIVKGAVILIAVLSDKKFDFISKTKNLFMHLAYRI